MIRSRLHRVGKTAADNFHIPHYRGSGLAAENQVNSGRVSAWNPNTISLHKKEVFQWPTPDAVAALSH
jgi:hypothetical protein